MRPTEVLAVFRSTVFDTVEPYLWSDTEAREFLNDAQGMLCRLVHGINDGETASVTQYVVAAGDTWLTLHPSILKIRSVQRQSDFRFLTSLNIEDLQNGSVPSREDYGVGQALKLDNLQGELLYLVLGISDGRARLLRRPAADDVVLLTVERLPLITVDATNDGDDVLEVRKEHHRHLVWWMAHLAYMKQDVETFDKSKAEEFEAKFRAYCEQARREKERREHKPRTVAYGGY